MKDGSFNGFYTSCIDSISHVTENGIVVSKVYYGENIKTIPVDDIIDISFESATLNANENAGEYRVYECNFTDQVFKKAFIDNRSICIASKNGDFGANDIIFMTSVYNNIKVIMFTDSQDRISRYFDGKNYFILDYKEDGTVDVMDLSNDKKISITNKSITTRAGVNKFQTFIDVIKEYAEYIAGKSIELNLESIQMITQIYANIESNPELHNQRVLLNWLSVAGDVVGVGAALFGTIPSGGLTLPLVAAQMWDLYNDMNNLLNEMCPDTETINRYKEYYGDKYGINVSTLPAIDIKSTSATLKGLISSGDGLKGNLHFLISPMFGDEHNYISANCKEVVTNQYEVDAHAADLLPDTWYMYYLEYQCTVDGLTFRYSKEAQDFTTLKPIALTGDAHDITSNSAVVDCEYKNAEGVWCGIHYSATIVGGGTENGVASASSDGKQSILLSGLEPNTTYTYYAIIKCGEKEYKGESKTFTTEISDISGTWNCKETHYDYAGNPYYKTYNLTLHEDGTVTDSRSVVIVGSSWSYSNSGKVRISEMHVATQTQNSGTDWTGTVDDISAPTKITGYTNTWNYNQIGSFTGDPFEFEMTR